MRKKLNIDYNQSEFRKNFGKASVKLRERALRTLVLIELKPQTSARRISTEMGLSDRTIETYIKRLKDRKLIIREGGRKEGNWQINKL